MVIDFVSRSELKPNVILQTIKLTIHTITIYTRQSSNSLLDRYRYCRREIRQTAQKRLYLNPNSLSCGRHHSHSTLKLRKAISKTSLTTATEDTSYRRESPITLLISQHSRWENRSCSLTLECLLSTTSIELKRLKACVYITLLEDGLTVNRETPAVFSKDKTCRIVIRTINRKCSVTR